MSPLLCPALVRQQGPWEAPGVSSTGGAESALTDEASSIPLPRCPGFFPPLKLHPQHPISSCKKDRLDWAPSSKESNIGAEENPS